jgi:hypothetical protein
MNKLPSINAYVIPVEDMAEFSKQGHGMPTDKQEQDRIRADKKKAQGK